MKKPTSIILIIVLILSVVIAGCTNDKTTSVKQTREKVKIGYYGGTCEAPLYIAKEKGFFAKNGLDVELVALAGDTLKEGIGTGKIDALMVSPALFKPIEQGLDIKITDGIHTGCIQAVAPANSPINKIADLKNKTIGVESIGGVPMTLLSVELNKAGINPKTEVSWKAYPGPQLSQAMEKGEVDVFATWDPFGEIAVKEGKAKNIFSTTHSPAYKNQYCCFVGVNGKLAKDDPETVRKITLSFAQAGQWVEENPAEAARITIEKKYSSGDIDTVTQLLTDYTFKSDPAAAEKSMEFYFKALKDQEIFDSTTDPEALLKSVFIKI